MRYLILVLLVFSVACGSETVVSTQTRKVEYQVNILEGAYQRVAIIWGDASGARNEENIAPPFTKKVDIPIGGDAYLGITGVAVEGGSVKVSLKILVEGKLVAEDTREGYITTFDIQGPVE